MAKTVTGVPTSITRTQYTALLDSLGLDPHQLKHLEFGYRSIEATVFALNPDGKRYEDPINSNSSATHRISIPIAD